MKTIKQIEDMAKRTRDQHAGLKLTKHERGRVNNQLIFLRLAKTYLETMPTEEAIRCQLDQINKVLDNQTELFAAFKESLNTAKEKETVLTDFEKTYQIKAKINQRHMLHFLLDLPI